MHPLAEVDQFHLSPLGLYRRVGPYEFSDARAIDVANLVQVKKDILTSLIEQAANRFAKHHVALAHSYPSTYINNGDVFDLADCRPHFRRSAALNPET